MATYAKVLLSGATYGSHQDIAIDTTYTTIHQTSTTSGAIEDVTVVVYNQNDAAVGITISIEQDGTVIKTFTDSVPANSSKTVVSQVTLGENIDVKIKQSVSGSPALSASNLIIGNSNDVYKAALDGSGVSTAISNIGSGSAFAVDAVNGYLFKGSGSYELKVYSLTTGLLLKTYTQSDLGTNILQSSSQYTAIPAQKKLHMNYVASATAVLDYSDIDSPVVTTVFQGGSNNVAYSGANQYGVFGFYSGSSQLYFYPWDSLTTASTNIGISSGWSIVSSAGGVLRGDPNGNGWAIFQGNGSYYAAHGTWSGGTPSSVASVPEFYAAECVFDGNGNIIYIPSINNGSYPIRKYALTSNSSSAFASTTSADYVKATNQNRGSMVRVNDGTNDVFIFHNSNNTGSKVVLSNLSVSTLANNPYNNLNHFSDMGTFTGKADQAPMYFTGYANQQLP